MSRKKFQFSVQELRHAAAAAEMVAVWATRQEETLQSECVDGG